MPDDVAGLCMKIKGLLRVFGKPSIIVALFIMLLCWLFQPHFLQIGSLYIIYIFLFILQIIYIIHHIQSIRCSLSDHVSIMAFFLSLLPIVASIFDYAIYFIPFAILSLVWKIHRTYSNQKYNHPDFSPIGKYSEKSLKSIFLYSLISFLFFILIYCIALSAASIELNICDHNIIIPPGEEKAVNISIKSKSHFCDLIYPTIVLSHNQLPNSLHISFNAEKGKPNFISTIMINVSPSTSNKDYLINITGQWVLFSGCDYLNNLPSFIEFNKNKTNITIKVPKLIYIEYDKNNLQRAGATIKWRAHISKSCNESFLRYKFKKNSTIAKWVPSHMDDTWIWKTCQKDIGKNLIEVEAYYQEKNLTYLGKSDLIEFEILENRPPIIMELVKDPYANYFKINASDPENDTIYYKFEIKSGNSGWEPVQGWSTRPYWSQSTDREDGQYKVRGSVRDEMHKMEDPDWNGSNNTSFMRIPVESSIYPETTSATENSSVAKGSNISDDNRVAENMSIDMNRSSISDDNGVAENMSIDMDSSISKDNIDQNNIKSTTEGSFAVQQFDHGISGGSFSILDNET